MIEKYEEFKRVSKQPEFHDYVREVNAGLKKELGVDFETLVQWMMQPFAGRPLYTLEDFCIYRNFLNKFIILPSDHLCHEPVTVRNVNSIWISNCIRIQTYFGENSESYGVYEFDKLFKYRFKETCEIFRAILNNAPSEGGTQ